MAIFASCVRRVDFVIGKMGKATKRKDGRKDHQVGI